MRQMLRLWRSRILTYLDHISGHAHFDDTFRLKEHQKKELEAEGKELPPLWISLMVVFVEKAEAEADDEQEADDEYAMNKARCIRTLYRWAARQNASKAKTKRCVVLDWLIELHFGGMLDWMLFADEQIMANTPLLIIESLRYSMRHPKWCALHQHMLDVLSLQQLKAILKLMSTTHHVIQFNAMLLTSNVIDFDPQTARMCAAVVIWAPAKQQLLLCDGALSIYIARLFV